MQRSKYVAIFIVAVVVIGLLAAQYSLNNPTETTQALTSNAGSTKADSSNEMAPAAVEAPDESGVDSNGVSADDAGSVSVPPRLGPAPTLTGLDGWLQTDATSLDSFSGQVRIVQFWTYSCDDCTATFPHLREIYADYHPMGLEIIGVHAPEFEYERDPNNVAAAATELGVTWPIALDTDKSSFRSWQQDQRFWPRTYVLDQNGEIRFNHIGKGDYEELAATVDYLITNGP